LKHRSVAADEKPIRPLGVPTEGDRILLDIPRRPKTANGAPNGIGDIYTNGSAPVSGTERGGKRRASVSMPGLEAGSPIPKRPKISLNGGLEPSDDIIVIEEDGSIFID